MYLSLHFLTWFGCVTIGQQPWNGRAKVMQLLWSSLALHWLFRCHASVVQWSCKFCALIMELLHRCNAQWSKTSVRGGKKIFWDSHMYGKWFIFFLYACTKKYQKIVIWYLWARLLRKINFISSEPLIWRLRRNMIKFFQQRHDTVWQFILFCMCVKKKTSHIPLCGMMWDLKKKFSTTW